MEAVAETMGKLVCVENCTNFGTRFIDARFYINLDVTQQFPSKIVLKNEEGEWFHSIVYDLLPIPCVVCKNFGHLGKDCQQKLAQAKNNIYKNR